jgi:hypothetical protein
VLHRGPSALEGAAGSRQGTGQLLLRDKANLSQRRDEGAVTKMIRVGEVDHCTCMSPAEGAGEMSVAEPVHP